MSRRSFSTPTRQIEEFAVETLGTRRLRHAFSGTPHGHTFTLDGNGFGYVRLVASRRASLLQTGLRGYTFMKATGSGCADFVDDDYRTLPDTHDRIAATSMDATWTWSRMPAEYASDNAKVLAILIEVCSAPPAARACRTACTGWARP